MRLLNAYAKIQFESNSQHWTGPSVKPKAYAKIQFESNSQQQHLTNALLSGC